MSRDEAAPALQAEHAGKRYRHVWGLRDCTFAVPAGAVVGLVGPNGAGKSTLLALTVGLLAPTEGRIAVFGETSRAHTAATLARVSYLAQDHPLYRGFSVADMLRFGRSMNLGWDQALALTRLDDLGIPLDRKVKALSGGQQAQVALTMALAKRAPLLALDEPVASLDPIARLEFMRDVMAASADTGLTVIIASHVIAELERLCDWLIVLTGGRLQLAGPIDDLLAAHQVLTVPQQTTDAELPGTTIHRADSDRHSTVLVATGLAELAGAHRPGWHAEPVGFEQLVLGYLQRPGAGDDRVPAGRLQQDGQPMIWVSWRQHRTQAIICLGLFCVLTVAAIVIGTWMRSVFSDDGLTTCLARTGGAGCPGAISAFISKFSGATIPVTVPLFIIPQLLGAVVGAPLLGRELELGTWRLAWSQTVPRTRWLATKLVLVTGGLVVFGVAVTAVMTWYRAPLDLVTPRLAAQPFNFEGLTLTSSLLCAFGLGVLAGLLLRNTIGAVVAAYVAWEIPTTFVALLNGPIRIPGPATMRLPCQAGCPGAGTSSVPPVTGHLGDLVLGVTRSGNELIVSYLPASRFWTSQLIGGGLYLVIAAVTLILAVWLLHRRTA